MLTSEISTTIHPAMKSSQWWLVLKQSLLLTEGAELGSASLPAPGSRPEHLPPPQRCHWGFYLHHWLKPCSQPYTSNSKSPVQCPHLQFSLWNRLSNQCGGKKKSLTSELNPITMNFNYSKSSLDLTFIESNAEVNGLALGLRSRVRPFCWSCKVFTMGFDF